MDWPRRGASPSGTLQGTLPDRPRAGGEAGATKTLRGTLLQLALGIVLLGLVGAQVDLGKVVVYARQVGLFDLVLATACLGLQHLLKGKRWQLILASQRLRYGYGEALRMYWSALFIGVVTPGRLGELSRLVYLKQDGVPLGRAMAGVVVDRLLDILVMMVMVGLGTGLWLVGGVATAGIIPTREQLLWLVAHLLPRQVRGTMEEGWDDLRAGLRMFFAARRELMGSVIMTCVSWGLYIGLVHLLISAMGLRFALGLTTFFIGASGLAAMVPISLAGIGTRDALLVWLAGLTGRPKEEGLVFSACILLLHVLTALVGAAGWSQGRRLHQPVGVVLPA